MKTELTTQETDELTERIARWAVSLKIGGLVAFLLETNRPIAPLSGNFCVAVGPMLDGLAPFSINAVGLFLQDDKAVCRLRDRILKLQDEPVNIQQPTGNIQ